MTNKLENMKTLRYLLIVSVLLILPAASVKAEFKSQVLQNRCELASVQYEFQSTSSMKGSGTALPNAAQNGVVVSGNAPGDNISAGGASGPRRSTMDDDPFGGGDIGDINKPQEPGTPIGDGMWLLLFLAIGYVAFGKLRRRWQSVRA